MGNPKRKLAQLQDVENYINELEEKVAALPQVVVVDGMTAISGTILDKLKAGDVVVKRDSSGDHSYRVSFLGTGGMCLTYSDCENVETVAYNKVEGVWTYDSTDVTHIAS